MSIGVQSTLSDPGSFIEDDHHEQLTMQVKDRYCLPCFFICHVSLYMYIFFFIPLPPNYNDQNIVCTLYYTYLALKIEVIRSVNDVINWRPQRPTMNIIKKYHGTQIVWASDERGCRQSITTDADCITQVEEVVELSNGPKETALSCQVVDPVKLMADVEAEVQNQVHHQLQNLTDR